MKLRNRLQNRNQDKTYRFLMAAIVLLSLLLVLAIGMLVVYQRNIRQTRHDEDTYQRHYLFIGKDWEDTLTNQVYQKMQEYGKTQGVYVERLDNSAFSDYTSEDYLGMSIAMKVDGIILEGEDTPEEGELINRAIQEGIPVITVFSDCKNCKRQSFIELGSYNLGREFGRQIISTAKGRNLTALLLTQDGEDYASQNMIYTGIHDTLTNEGNHLNVDLQIEQLDTSYQFSESVRIREILVDSEELPDIIICTNAKETEAVYLALVDQNLVGKVELIGYCVSDTILKAIENGGIVAAVNVDTEQMGRTCVDVLNEYIETGHVSDYIIVDTDVIDQENIKRYLMEEESE